MILWSCPVQDLIEILFRKYINLSLLFRSPDPEYPFSLLRIIRLYISKSTPDMLYYTWTRHIIGYDRIGSDRSENPRKFQANKVF
jgi:hypothetical protein